MDFPKSVPSIGLVNGQFVDEDALTGRPGSMIPSAWGNAVTLEILNVLAGAGVVPDELKTNQLAEAISKIVAISNIAWDKVFNKPTTLSGYGVIGTDPLLARKPDSDNVGVLGLSGSDLTKPYLSRKTDNQICLLQPQLGYIPVQQGTGIDQASNTVKIGFSSVGVKLTVDTTDMGNLWYAANFNPNTKLTGDAAKYAGFASGNKSAPYIRHIDETIVYLATADNAVPSGTVAAFARNTAPAGWLKANGSAVSRTTYAGLFNSIGAVFGGGDGTTTFNLPDLRAEVIRGWDDGRGVDPGRGFASLQLDAFQGHAHSLFFNASAFVGGGGNQYAQLTTSSNSINGIQDAVRGALSDGVNGAPRIANETRSRNLALLYCIKI